MAENPLLEQGYTVDTPENVAFVYEIAGIGNRFIAALIDTTILFALLLLINTLVLIALAILGDLTMDTLLGDNPPSWFGGLVLALYALVNFALFWGYYVLFEFLWNGQTPGKRVVKIRVLRMDGNPAGIVEVLLRNLVRPIDFIPGGYGLGLLVMLLNEKSRRLGDFAAGTLVIREMANISLDALAPISPPGPSDLDEALLLAFPEIRRLSRADYELIQETLARFRRGTILQQTVERLAGVIAARLGAETPHDWDGSFQFLQRVAAAYRQLGR